VRDRLSAWTRQESASDASAHARFRRRQRSDATEEVIAA